MDDDGSNQADGHVFEDVRVLRRNWWLVLVIALAPATACGGCEEVVAERLVVYPLVGVALISAILAFYYGFLRRSLARQSAAARLVVDADGVHLDGRLRVPRSRIRQAHAQPRAHGFALVVITTSRVLGRLELCLSDEAEARRLVEVLGMDVTRTTATFNYASPWLTSVHGTRLVYALVAAIVLWRPVVGALSWRLSSAALLGIWLVLPFLLFAVALVRAIHGTLVIGADGVWLKWLLRTKYIPFEGVVRMDQKGEDVLLHLASAPNRPVAIRPFDPRGARHGLERDAVAARLTAALEAFRKVSRGQAVAMLARSGRTGEAWLRDLRALGLGKQTYRIAATGSEHLWSVLLDPASEISSRAAAAAALGPTLDDAGIARLRVAATACASPVLRAALESAATPDDEEMLLRSLEAIDEETRRV